MTRFIQEFLRQSNELLEELRRNPRVTYLDIHLSVVLFLTGQLGEEILLLDESTCPVLFLNEGRPWHEFRQRK